MTFFETITVASLIVGPIPMFGVLVWVGRQAQRLDRAEKDITDGNARFHGFRNQITVSLADLQLKVERLLTIAEEAKSARAAHDQR